MELFHTQLGDMPAQRYPRSATTPGACGTPTNGVINAARSHLGHLRVHRRIELQRALDGEGFVVTRDHRLRTFRRLAYLAPHPRVVVHPPLQLTLQAF